MEGNVIAFRRRFVKDFNLPINIVDSPYFEYYMDRYDFFPKEEYFQCCDIINKQFNGNIDAWLAHYAEVRDNIITTIENSDAFKEFNKLDLEDYRYPNSKVGDLNIYNNTNVGYKYVSIDLKKANFQTLKYINPEIVCGCKTYEELMEKFGGDDYFKKSKYTRQVIFGKLNPKRTIYFEKKLICDILHNIDNDKLHELCDNSTLVTVKSDEIVFRLDKPGFEVTKETLNEIKMEIKLNHDLDVSVEAFHLSRIVCENHNGNTVDGYVRRFYIDGNRYDLKNVSSIFFPQIYAYMRGLQLTHKDLVFKAEDQIAAFLYPLKYIN